VDRLIGDWRSAMEGAGLWDTAAVLVTSDHPLRPDVWRRLPTWSEEMAEASGNRQHPSIAYLLKLPGQRSGALYGAPFNAVLTQEMLLEILRGKLSSTDSVTRWLETNRSRVPLYWDVETRSPRKGKRPANRATVPARQS
jgi:hypothetical protein